MTTHKLVPAKTMTIWDGQIGVAKLASLPWHVIAPHEAQAKRNHDQTLAELQSRGGLDAAEAVAILEDRPWRDMTTTAATARLIEIILAAPPVAMPADAGEDEAKLIEWADYLDRLEGELISRNVDMQLPDEPFSPSLIADKLRVLAARPERDAAIDECIAVARAEAGRRRAVAAALIAAPDEHHAQLTGEETAGNIEAALAALKSHPAPPAQDERGLIVEWLRNSAQDYRDLPMGGRDASLIDALADGIQRGDHLPPTKAE